MVGFIHPLTIEHVTYDDTTDDEMGQPVPETTESTVSGLVQPHSTHEMVDHRSAGSPIGSHVIFLPSGTDITNKDSIVYGDERYQVIGEPRAFRYGNLAHIEVDAERIGDATVTLGDVVVEPDPLALNV